MALGNYSSKGPDASQELSRHRTQERRDRAARFAQTRRDPGVAGVERRVGPASAIPAAAERDRATTLIDRVGAPNVLAETGESGRRQVHRQDRETRVAVFPRGGLAKTIGQEDGLAVPKQRLDGNTRGEGPAIAVVIAPADFYVIRVRVITTGRPQ